MSNIITMLSEGITIPVSQTLTLLDADGVVLQSVVNEYEIVNPAFVGAVILFSIAFVSLFKLIGGVFCRA